MNQQTGIVAEQEVILHFSRWGWTVGRDFLDTGIDLIVEAEKSRYLGARFLVQVKGTIQKNRRASLIAPVDKTRLAEYVRNPHPVFLIRVASNGSIYWLHVQEWAKANYSRISGSGTARIPMDPKCDLNDRQTFEKYLDKVMTPSAHKLGALAKIAEERMSFLNNIDPRFRVQVNVKNGKEEHEIFAVSPDASANVQFHAKNTPDNVANLNDSIDFGLPRAVKVSQFQLGGSPLFDALGATAAHTGTLTIRGKPRKGFIRIYPGLKFSFSIQFLEIEAELFSGQKGLAVSSESIHGLFGVDARIELRGQGKTTLSIRKDLLTSVPIRDLNELARAGDWAEKLSEEKAMFIELFFGGRRAHFPTTSLSMEEGIGSWLFEVRLLSRLHLIAKYLDSDFIISEECSISEQEAGEIEFIYHLLRGERLAGGSASMVVDPPTPTSFTTCTKDILATTSLILTVGGRELGAIPIAIEMPGYTFEPIPETTKFRVYHPDGGDSWVTYDPDGSRDVSMRLSTKNNN